MNLCRIYLAGHLTRDPELRYTPKGTAITKASVAVNRKWKDRSSGEEKEEATFIDVDAFGKQAETLGRFGKGDNILVEGRLKSDSWEDKKTGQTRSKLVVVCEGYPVLVSYPPDEKPSRSRAESGAPESNDDVPF